MVAVRWYLRYGLSYRDVEELLAERGIDVDHVTVYRWVHRFTLLLADAARFARHSPGDRVTPAPSSRASRADPRRPGAPSVKAVLTRREPAGARSHDGGSRAMGWRSGLNPSVPSAQVPPDPRQWLSEQ
ncbi:hypothetical protein Adi01nite_79890 [Amorphoplanes digitatis]|nr:hypothetical protein Adi01nite_79890 [Actinoplanes digitatis]